MGSYFPITLRIYDVIFDTMMSSPKCLQISIIQGETTGVRSFSFVAHSSYKVRVAGPGSVVKTPRPKQG